MLQNTLNTLTICVMPFLSERSFSHTRTSLFPENALLTKIALMVNRLLSVSSCRLFSR